jgi:hypothetical protein
VISAGLIEPGTSVDLFLSVDDPDTQVSGDEVPPYSFKTRSPSRSRSRAPATTRSSHPT